MIKRVEAGLRHGALPKIPVQTRRHGFGVQRKLSGLAEITALPFWAIDPRVDFGDLAKDAGLDPFLHLANAVIGVALIAHVRHHLVFLGGEAERARLPDIVRERFLRDDVLAALHALEGGGKVSVIGSVDADGVDFLTHLVEHHAEIGEFFRGRERWVGFVVLAKLCFIHVAEPDHIFIAAGAVGHAGNAARPDHRDVDLAVR